MSLAQTVSRHARHGVQSGLWLALLAAPAAPSFGSTPARYLSAQVMTCWDSSATWAAVDPDRTPALAAARVRGVEAATGPRSESTGQMLDCLLRLQVITGHPGPDSALALAKRTVALWDGRVEPTVLYRVNARYWLSLALAAKQDSIGAEAAWQETRRLALASLPSDSLLRNQLGAQSLLFTRLGRLHLADQLSELAMEVFERSVPGSSDEWLDFLPVRANVIAIMGDMQGAERLDRRALAFARSNPATDPGLLAQLCQNQASDELVLGRTIEARTLLEEALTLIPNPTGALDSAVVATVQGNLATIDLVEGDLRSSDRHFRIALAAPPTAETQLNDGIMRSMWCGLLHHLGRFEEARAQGRQALRVVSAASGDSSAYTANCRANLAMTLIALGDTAEAVHQLEWARADVERTVGHYHPFMLSILGNLASVDESRGDGARAARRYAEALEIADSLYAPGHPDACQIRLGECSLQFARGLYSPALASALALEHVSREMLENSLLGMSARQGLAFASSLSRGLDVALSTVLRTPTPADVDSVWNLVISERGLVASALAEREQALHSAADLETRTLLDSLARQNTRLNEAISSQGGDGHASQAASLRLSEGRDALERQLALRSETVRTRAERRAIDVQAIRRSLGPDEALVGYFEFERLVPHTGSTAGHGPIQLDSVRTTVAFVQRGPGRGTKLVTLGPSDRIDRAVGRWRDAAIRTASAHAAQDPAEVAAELAGNYLRRLAWDPVAPELRGARQVFVVPAGTLSFVNFAALPTGAGRYLLDAPFAISLLATEREAVGTPSQAPTRGRGLLAVGGIDFDARPLPPAHPSATTATAAEALRGSAARCPDLAERTFTSLPYSGTEVEAIATLYNSQSRGSEASAIVLQGRAASEGAFKSEVAGRRYVHVATHGVFLPEFCGGARAYEGAPIEDPLLRCCLALAGANRPHDSARETEDGLLTGEDLAALDLHSAEVVVLSACESGLGDLRGAEGVLGLRRALAIAGAHSVVMSLWNVGDTSALGWMQEFYRGMLVHELGSAEAARQASKAVLAERRREGHGSGLASWAPFIESALSRR